MDPRVRLWWVSLSLIGVVNILVFLRLAVRARPWRTQLTLAGIYTVVCASRSWLPRADVQRFCIVDSWWSTVLVGRSLATVAEICFAAQWALLLRDYARDLGATTAERLSRVIVPIICVAEVFSWYATITTNYIGNAVEESLWAVAVTVLAIGIVLMRGRAALPMRRKLDATIAACAIYVAYMVTADVPMYIARWRTDQAAGRPYFDLANGLVDVASRWVVTTSFEDWGPEMPWMSLYFSLAVWGSLFIAWVSARRSTASAMAN